MNKRLEQFARSQLKLGMEKLPEKCHVLFKRMYSPGCLDIHIDDCIDGMPAGKLDWAMQQMERTIAHQLKKAEE